MSSTSKNELKIVKKITSAGLTLIGEYTPSAASDYCLGSNHVLPTDKEQQYYKEKHYIPDNMDLSFQNFEEFYNQRRKIIFEELKKILLQ